MASRSHNAEAVALQRAAERHWDQGTLSQSLSRTKAGRKTLSFGATSARANASSLGCLANEQIQKESP